jgi:hypothetical protein
MAIMKWNTPPTGNEYDRHAHDGGHGENVALQHAAFGDHVEGGAQVNTLGPNVELATKWSTAPYRGDAPATVTRAPGNPYGYRDKSRQGRCIANDDTCNGFATKASGLRWCGLHAIHVAKQAE